MLEIGTIKMKAINDKLKNYRSKEEGRRINYLTKRHTLTL